MTVVGQDLDALVLAAVAAGIDPGLALRRTANEAAADAERARCPRSGYLYASLLRMEQNGRSHGDPGEDVLSEMLDPEATPWRSPPRRGSRRSPKTRSRSSSGRSSMPTARNGSAIGTGRRPQEARPVLHRPGHEGDEGPGLRQERRRRARTAAWLKEDACALKRP